MVSTGRAWTPGKIIVSTSPPSTSTVAARPSASTRGERRAGRRVQVRQHRPVVSAGRAWTPGKIIVSTSPPSTSTVAARPSASTRGERRAGRRVQVRQHRPVVSAGRAWTPGKIIVSTSPPSTSTVAARPSASARGERRAGRRVQVRQHRPVVSTGRAWTPAPETRKKESLSGPFMAAKAVYGKGWPGRTHSPRGAYCTRNTFRGFRPRFSTTFSRSRQTLPQKRLFSSHKGLRSKMVKTTLVLNSRRF